MINKYKLFQHVLLSIGLQTATFTTLSPKTTLLIFITKFLSIAKKYKIHIHLQYLYFERFPEIKQDFIRRLKCKIVTLIAKQNVSFYADLGVIVNTATIISSSVKR